MEAVRAAVEGGPWPIADLEHPINMLRCGPSKQTFVLGAAFLGI